MTDNGSPGGVRAVGRHQRRPGRSPLNEAVDGGNDKNVLQKKWESDGDILSRQHPVLQKEAVSLFKLKTRPHSPLKPC